MRKLSDNKPRLVDQFRTIINKGWFSNLEILEIHQNINNEQDSNTISDTPSFNKQKIVKPKLRKIETPHNQTTQNKHYHKNKS